MVKRLAESWDHWVNVTDGIKGYTISEKVKGRSKRRRFIVPRTNVEAVEQYLKDGSFVSASTWLELERIRDD